jgi:hypothetical protein
LYVFDLAIEVVLLLVLVSLGMLKAVADPKKRARTAAGTSRRHHWRTRARATRLRRLEHRHRLRQLRDVREPHAPRPPARADRHVHPVRVRAPHVRAVGATAPRPPPASALGLTRSVGATSGQPKPAKPAEMRNRRPQEKRRFEQRFPRRAELRRGSLRELRIHVRRFRLLPGPSLLFRRHPASHAGPQRPGAWCRDPLKAAGDSLERVLNGAQLARTSRSHSGGSRMSYVGGRGRLNTSVERTPAATRAANHVVVFVHAGVADRTTGLCPANGQSRPP